MEILELKNSLCAVVSCFGRVWLFVTLWSVACQVPLFMGFSRQEYWSALPCPLPGNLPDLGIEPSSLVSSALAYRFFTASATWEAPKLKWKFMAWVYLKCEKKESMNLIELQKWFDPNNKKKKLHDQTPKARNKKVIFKRGKLKFTLYTGNNNMIYC